MQISSSTPSLRRHSKAAVWLVAAPSNGPTPSNTWVRPLISSRLLLATTVRRCRSSGWLRRGISRISGSWLVRFTPVAWAPLAEPWAWRESALPWATETLQNSRQGNEFRVMAFFDSDIVQDEAKRLFGDYQQLMQLGSDYGKFDREGKKKFIETMEELMGRYRVFMKRFELSEDFQAKLTVEQLRTQLSQFGITPEQMFDQMNSTLERMKAQIEQPPSS